MKNLQNYLFELIVNEDLDWIDDVWMDTKYRWLAGNKPSMIENVSFEHFKSIVNSIKKDISENVE